MAQAVVAWIACVLLIDSGYIDECLEPVKGQRLLRGNFEEFHVALTGPDRIVLPQTTYKQLGLAPILPPPIVVCEESVERKEETTKKVEVEARKDAREQPPPSGPLSAAATHATTTNGDGNKRPTPGEKAAGTASCGGKKDNSTGSNSPITLYLYHLPLDDGAQGAGSEFTHPSSYPASFSTSTSTGAGTISPPPCMALALSKRLDGVNERGVTLGEDAEQDPVLSFLGAVEVSADDVKLAAQFSALLAYHAMYGKLAFLCSSEYYVGQQHEKDIWRPDCDKGYLLLPLLQHQQQRTQPRCGRTPEHLEVDWAAVHHAGSAPVGPSCWPLPVDTPVSELMVLSHAWHPQRPRQYRILGVSSETLGERLRREDERDEFVRKKVEEVNGRGTFETTSSNAINDTAKEAMQREEQPREGKKGEREEDDEEVTVGEKRKAQGVGSAWDQQQRFQSTKKAKPVMTRELLEHLLATDSGELTTEATKVFPHKTR